MSISEFFNMGGYGFYVWSSYGVATLVFLGLIVSVRTQRKKIVKQLKRRNHREKLQADKDSARDENVA